MTSPRRRPGLRAASVAAAGTACFLLAACGGSSAAAPVPAPVTTTAAQLSRSFPAPTPEPATAATRAAQSVSPVASSAPPASPSVSLPPTSAGPATEPSAESSPASDVTAGGSACSLVTEQDATLALGSDPGAGQPVTSHGASQCQYGSFQTSLVLVNITPSEGGAAYDRMRHDPKLASAGTSTDMPGLGDRAFGITGHGTGSIWINKGDSLVLVMVAEPHSASAPQDSVIALAKKVAGRL